MSFPEVSTIRKRIESATNKEAKYCLMAEYLFCARISEIIGRKCPSDIKTVARGISGTDIKQETFREGSEIFDVAVFTLRTAKRGGKERKIALPLDAELEPFAEPLFDYISQFGDSHAFPFTRQKAFNYAKEIFNGLEYPIERYRPSLRGVKLPFVEEHPRDFRTHALRHLRATELLDRYDFTGVELSLYGGWTLRSMIGVGSSMSRYSHLQWKKYFPKLIMRR